MLNGNRVKFAKLKLGYTNKDLANILNTTKTRIRHILLGWINPRPQTIKRIADALKVSPEFLLDLSDDTDELLRTDEEIKTHIFMTRLNELYRYARNCPQCEGIGLCEFHDEIQKEIFADLKEIVSEF